MPKPKTLQNLLSWLGGLALLLALLVQSLAAQEPQRAPSKPALDYMIVVTGGELLAGVYPDGHTHFLTRTLRPLGLHCVGSITVDDRPADIKETLRYATRRAKLVIVTGGLGPTDNDVTRQTLSEFTGIALREQPDVLQAIERRLKISRDQLRPNLRRQTEIPQRGTYLKSQNGTAVGLVFESPDAVIVALPGPPRELQPMVRDQLVPYLSRQFGTRTPGCSLTVRFVGLGQSQISHVLHEHFSLPADVILSTQFEGIRVDFNFALPDDTPNDQARLAELKQKILAIPELAASIYATDETSLEELVGKRLAARDWTLTVAEVGSAGGLAAALDGVDNAPGILAGAYVAPTEEHLCRLLRVADDDWSRGKAGLQRLDLLASAAAEATSSDWAIAVGEAQQGQDGRFVEVVIRQPDSRLERLQLGLRGRGELMRAHLTTQLLDQLRRRLR
jgi:nicotinamide-nucleotide amidase